MTCELLATRSCDPPAGFLSRAVSSTTSGSGETVRAGRNYFSPAGRRRAAPLRQQAHAQAGQDVLGEQLGDGRRRSSGQAHYGALAAPTSQRRAKSANMRVSRGLLRTATCGNVIASWSL